jgi:DNA-binding CsgD family transcriptional regulator/ABC-type iron transport system FetAB ATPase subunit
LVMGLKGRGAEQEAIGRLIQDARAGHSGVLAIVGEPGMGKSALLDDGASLAGGDAAVLRARGVQSEAQIPFAGLSELLRPALQYLDRIPEHLAGALEGALALVPSRAENRFALGAATLSLLSAYAEDRFVLVLVDDIHWIDGSSADAMSFAFRRLLADPVAVVLSARSGEGSLLDSSDFRQLRVEGLDVFSASELICEVAGKVPEDLAGRLHRHTGGNPLALIEAAREIELFRNGSPLDVPLPVVTRVTDVYSARILALKEPCRRLLLLAAAGDTGDLAILAKAAGLLGLDVEDLSAAEEGGLVHFRDGRLEFRHPLARSAAYNDASPAERRQAHRALSGSLPDADADRRAWHLALAAVGPDDSASRALVQSAVRSRERNAFDVASRSFERAAQLASEHERRAELLFFAAEAAWSAGHGERSLELLDQADRHTTGESALAADHLRGRIFSRIGPVAAGTSILMAAADRCTESNPEDSVVMLAEAVNAAFYAGDASTMKTAEEMIAAIDLESLSERTQFFGTLARGMALAFSGNPHTGSELLRRAVKLAERSNEAADDPTWLTWVAMGPLWLRESETGRSLIDQATDLARSRVAIGLLPYLLCHVAIDHASTHHWAEAEAAFYEVIQLSLESNQRIDMTAALARLAWVEARQGKSSACVEHAHEAIRLAGELNLELCRAWALAALGDLNMVLGHTNEALYYFGEQASLLRSAGIADVDLSPGPELVELHLRQGNPDIAADIAREYADQAELKGQPWALARAARARGLLADDTQLDDVFSEALDFQHRTPDLFEAGRTYLAYGSRLRRARQRIKAREYLQRAINIFEALGAEPWAAVARLELTATGATARKRDESTRNNLTPQELQIAFLLTSGNTTRQAAAALFLSPKTVEYHLRSVYRKLGCNNRDELSSLLRSTSQDSDSRQPSNFKSGGG